MKSNIFIPKTIRVGFQNRNDTYTKRLAYVIYIDELGKVRKESSWDGWRDHKIEPIDFENTPTSGFVLNKKVGDYADGWNHRKSYIRVYDPRNFEFEVDVSNLLYILENTNSIKGKGLDGEFVYGWDGKDLVLIPTESPDYKEIQDYNSILHGLNYIKPSDLVIGGTYLSKDNEEYIYMGKFDKYDYCNGENNGKYFWMMNSNEYLSQTKSVSKKFIKCISSSCVENYSEIYERMIRTKEFSPVDIALTKYTEMSYDDFCSIIEKGWYSSQFLDSNLKLFEVAKKEDGIAVSNVLNRNEYGYWNKQVWTKFPMREIFENKKPVYKEIYLKNGLFYKRETN